MGLFNKKNNDVAGHVIKKTRGTSNEITFSVLDTKVENDEKNSQDHPWEINKKDVQEKKKKRTRKKRLVFLSIATCVCILIVGITLALASYIQINSGSLAKYKDEIKKVSKISEDLGNYRAILANVSYGDTNTIASTGIKDNCDKYIREIQKEQEKLNECKSKIESLINDIATPADKEAGNNTIMLINSENELINCEVQIFKVGQDYIKNREIANSVLKKMIEADSLERSASQLLLNGNIEDANSSIEESQKAKSMWEDVNNMLHEIKYETLDVSQHILFCEKKIQAQEKAIVSAKAYVNRNKEELKSNNDEYNILQEESQEIASEWNEEIYEIIDKQFFSTQQTNLDKVKSMFAKRDTTFQLVKNYLDKQS